MKKNRFISMFLSLALSLSCFPMTAIAASGTQPTEDTNIVTEEVSASSYSSKADYSDNTVEPDSEEDGNKFLTVYNRNYHWTGAKIQFDAKTDTTYTLTFKLRLTVDTDSVGTVAPQFRVYSCDPKATCVQINGKSGQLISKSVSSDSWTEYKIANMKVNSDGTAMLLVMPYGAANHWYSFDIDDVKVVDASGNNLVNNDFEAYETGAMAGDQVLTDTYGGKVINYRYDGNKKYTASFAVNEEDTYYEVDVANGNALTATFTKELQPGTYTYSIKLRNNEYKTASPYLTSTASQNAFTAYAKVYTVDGGEGGIGSSANTVTVNETWTELSFTFDIAEVTTLSKIDVVINHAIATHETIKLSFKDMIFASEEVPASSYFNYTAKAVEPDSEDAGNQVLTVYNRNYHWTGAKIQFDAKTGTTYNLTFRVRLAVNTDQVGTTNPQLRVMPYDPKETCEKINNSTSQLLIKAIPTDGSWVDFEIKNMKVNTNGTAMLLVLPYGAANHWYPFEMDDIKVVDASGNTIVDQDFETYEVGAMAGDQELTDEYGGKIISYRYDNSTKYTTAFAINAEETYYEINVANGTALEAYINKELQPGTYTYSIKLRNDEYKTASPYLTATASENSFTAYAEACTAASGDTAIGSPANTVTVRENWTELSFRFNVKETTTLTKLNIVINHAVDIHKTVKLDFKDMTLTTELLDAEDIGEDKIILFGDDYYNDDKTNARYISAEEAGNKYLTVYGRNYHWTGIKVQLDAVKEETYTLSFDIRTNAEISDIYNDVSQVRVYFGDPQLDKTNPVVGGKPAQVGGNKNTKVIGNEWTYVEFDEITALADGTLTLPIITLGHQSHIYSFDIDNIRVTPASSDEAIVDQNFELCNTGDLAAGEGIKSANGVIMPYIYNSGKTVSLSISQEEPYFAINVKNGGKLNIDVNEVLKPGAYTYKILMRNAEFDADEDHVAYSGVYTNNNSFDVYAVADASIKPDYASTISMTIGETYTEFSFVFTFDEETKLNRLTLVLNHYVESQETIKVQFKDMSVTYMPFEEENGHAGLGIIMMLLAKKKDGVNGSVAADPNVGLIENSGFSQPVTIKGVITEGQTEDDAGWYAKFSEDSETNIYQLTENSNNILRVTGVTSGQRGVYYNTGIVLQPGKYTLNAYLRVTEGAYGDGMWRDSDKSTMQMRINLQNPQNPNSPQYAPNNGVDKDTTYTENGDVIGTLATIGRDWTLYTDTIVVEEPTLAVLKIGGGTGGAYDAHDFDIDNLTLIPEGTDYTPTAPVEVIFDSLIKNGNFESEPRIEAGEYNAAVTDTWFRNSGMYYQYDSKGNALKDQPMVMHEMNLDYNDGYLTLTGRRINLRGISITPSAVLEPGTYELSIDFKTPNKDETTVNRVYIFTPDGKTTIFNPGSTNVANVTNEWSTYTCSFNITNATAIKIELRGGPNASYIQDYSFDNVVLKKVK